MFFDIVSSKLKRVTMTIAYNYSIVTIPDPQDNSNVAFDVYYFDEANSKMSCVRVLNVYLSFLVHRIPGWTIEQTARFIESRAHRISDDDIVCEYRDDLKDASYTILETKPFEYVEVFSRSPSRLKQLEDMLEKDIEAYYAELNYKSLDVYDRIIIRQTETPFRNTAQTTVFNKAAYWFSREFNVPFVGFIEIHVDKLDEYKGDYLKLDERKIEKTYILNANDADEFHNENVRAIFKEWSMPTGYKANQMNKITVASYDIETYNKGENPSEHSLKQYIFCIGLGFFHLMENRPFIRYCLISADISTDPEVKDRIKPFNLSIETDIEFKAYLITDEYLPYKKEAYVPDIGTIYICVKNESELINVYVDLLLHHSPHLINGFNNFAFDDVWIYSRASRKRYSSTLLNRYLQVFSTYDVRELETRKISSVMPKYQSFSLKMEGKERGDGTFTVRAPVIQVIDVMKMLQKADAKRFSQQWKLDYMLETYHIKNPYNQAPLKKTGLSIGKMFEYWDKREHLYEIALYCTQDAWICGTLIIERSTVIDKLSMSNVTHTAFSDSIYHADGMRVSCTRACYGKMKGFAVMDEPYKYRDSMKNDNWKLEENEQSRGIGMKQFDTRGYIGGAVRNKHSRRSCLIVAGDFSAQYPSQYRAGNIASCTNVDRDIIENPETYGIDWVHVSNIVDTYGPRRVFYGKYKKE